MADLSWIEQQMTNELASTAGGFVSLCKVRPGQAEAMRRAVVARLDEDSRELLLALAAQINEEAA
ncbi:hypothetical protein ABT369_39470 [Dactylosporangium sp. NPDC000244]|uniref:hypothetical protein n=1 Tax=Dactylosporangium sp. NPDC000244 TaxID=3154365 RepID=UPI00332A5ADA